MGNKITNWLQIKVFIGLGALLLGSITIVLYLDLIAQENHANQQLLSFVKQLEVQGKAIQRRGITYAENAPRDYAPYERDIIIFYPDFMRDLQAFETQITRVTQLANDMPRTLASSTSTTITDSIHNLASKWHTFKNGFEGKLGPNKKEPRLEWGADYVKENQELINNVTGMLITTIESAIKEKLEANKKLSNTSIYSAGVLLVLGIIWFYFSVIRRITLTIKGCQRVAKGDFGYQLPDQANDELGALASAFNTLSARTRFVLTMLSKMHRHGSAESKINELWNEAGGYLPIQWLGLFELDSASNKFSLMSIRTERKTNEAMNKTLDDAISLDSHLLSICKQQLPVKYDDLTEISSNIPNAKLVRELMKIGLLKSALFVPLVADDNWQGLMVLVAQEAASYTDEQVELMGNLAPFMANGFAQTANASGKANL